MVTDINDWLFLAEQDLITAEYVLHSKDGLFHISIYHSHQSIEKILKAFLIIKDVINLPKIHLLGKLLILAAKFNKNLANLEPKIMELDQFLPLTRYPTGDRLTKKDAKHCYEIAAEIYKQILMTIKDEK